MATNLSQTGLEVDKVEESDIATGGTDKVLLYASGSGSATRLYVKAGSNTQKQLGFDIDQFDAKGDASIHQTDDHFIMSDGGTEKKITFSNLQDAVFADVSGDATIAAGGALTIEAGAVENSMLADDAVGADELAANAVVNASIASNAAIDMDKLDGGSLASSLSDLAQGDLLYAGDVDDSNNLKSITFSNLEDAIFGNVSGDAAIAAGGALIIAANAVEGSMLNSNTAGDGLGYESNALVVQVSGALAIASDKVGLSGSVAGDGLAFSGSADAIGGLSVNVDDSSIEINSDSLRVKAQGITNAMLADDAVGADELAANAVVEASIVDNAVTLAKMAGITRGSIIVGDSSGDPSYLAKGSAAQFLQSDGTDPSYVTISGDATVAAGGALTIANDAVEQAMIADDAVGADQLASNAVVNASVASNAAIVATKLNFNVDLGGDVTFGDQSDDRVTFSGPVTTQAVTATSFSGSSTLEAVGAATLGSTLAVSGNVSLASDIIISGRIDFDADNDTSIRSAADDQIQLEVGGTDMVTVLSTGVGVNGGYGSGNGISLGADGTVNADSNLNLGADGSGASIVAYGATANERFMYDNTNHVIQFRDSSAATMLTLGGDATTEYALDVANGSNNINKVRAAAFVTYSDESLKSDIKSMNTALDTVMSLEGVEFTWKDSGERDFGFIAQDVQSVLPKAVHVAEDGVQGVDYSRLTSVLVEAVKAQQVQIEELKALLKK